LKYNRLHIFHPSIYSQNGPFIPKTDHFLLQEIVRDQFLMVSTSCGKPSPVTVNETGPGAEIPGAEISGAEIPGAEVPGAEVSGAEVPGAEIPAAPGWPCTADCRITWHLPLNK
jgi:hypothetical protein